jgi:hypothetical protein
MRLPRPAAMRLPRLAEMRLPRSNEMRLPRPNEMRLPRPARKQCGFRDQTKCGFSSSSTSGAGSNRRAGGSSSCRTNGGRAREAQENGASGELESDNNSVCGQQHLPRPTAPSEASSNAASEANSIFRASGFRPTHTSTALVASLPGENRRWCYDYSEVLAWRSSSAVNKNKTKNVPRHPDQPRRRPVAEPRARPGMASLKKPAHNNKNKIVKSVFERDPWQQMTV